MTTRLAKEHVPFLADAMDRKHGIVSSDSNKLKVAAGVDADEIKGPMSIPEPVSVDVQGDMSVQE